MYKNHTKYVREIVSNLPNQFTVDDVEVQLPKYNCMLNKPGLRYIMCRLRQKGEVKIIKKPAIKVWHYVYQKLPNQTKLFKEPAWQQVYENLPEQFTVRVFKDNLRSINPEAKLVLVPSRLRELSKKQQLNIAEKVKHTAEPAIYEKILNGNNV